MRPQATVWSGDLTALTTKDFWCAFGYQEPLLAVNLVFLLNVSVLFWFISLLQVGVCSCCSDKQNGRVEVRCTWAHGGR